jgi:hypothetical protein
VDETSVLHITSVCGWVSGIYVNKNVKLDDLQVYGFDYDYTLSHYSEHVQCLIYDLAKKHLVNEVGLLLARDGLGWFVITTRWVRLVCY